MFLEVVFLPAAGELHELNAFLDALVYDLVVDVGDVHDVVDFVLEVVAHHASEHVAHDVAVGVAKVRVGVNGGTAAVPVDLPAVDGDELHWLDRPQTVHQFESCSVGSGIWLGSLPAFMPLD